jgi:hypothetical protein
MLRVSQLSGFSSAGLDADAQAFVVAAGLTDSTQTKAIDRLVKDLKGYAVWTKMSAIYPFVGGTSTTHKFNLKDPRDLDAAFRGTFSGTVTHDANGITPNGTTGFMDTKLNPNTQLGQFNTHMSFYCRTLGGAGDTMADFGCFSATPTYFDLTARYTDARGMFTGTRRANNDLEIYKNGATQQTIAVTDTGILPSFTMYLGALNHSGTAEQFSNRNYAFASVGSGLTDTDAANLYTAVQAYQTTLDEYT